MKQLDLKKSVAELIKQYPELKALGLSLGLKQLDNKLFLATVGKTMTISKGARMMGVPLDRVISELKSAGFTVIK